MSEVLQAQGRAPRERLLVCLDLQQASLGRAGRAEADPYLVNCRRLLAHGRHAGWRIVHVHTKQALAAAARPIAGLEPLPSEPVVYRSGLSPFSSGAFRRLVANEALELVIVGYAAPASCLATALIANDDDLMVTLVSDAVPTAPMDPETRDALALVAQRMGRPAAKVVSTGALLGSVRLLRAV